MPRWFVFPLLLLALLPLGPAAHAAEVLSADCVIYGGTPAGIAAAISAAELESSVILVEPYANIGGLVTNGLSHTDFRTFEGLTGTFLEFNGRVQGYYEGKYGAGSPQTKNWQGSHGEPHVNLLLFEQMLGEHKNIRVLREHRLREVKQAEAGTPQRIIEIRCATNGPELQVIKGKVFIDASYEGDLMAAAGVPFRVGREAKSEHGESLAPAQADDQVQGYNFRFCLTQVPENRVMPTKPAGYNREDYLGILPLMEQGKLKSIFCAPSGGVYKYQPPILPNEKYDINDVSRGIARLSLPDLNDAWPDGTQATRQELFATHVRHNAGLLYFLQNDEAVPAKFQHDARQWGFCADEFATTGHLPEQLYVREARRMEGRYVFTENDTNHAQADARSRFHPTSIAMGDYGPNCHGTDHTGPRFGGKHTGEFYKRVPPYQIPYEVMVPKNCENLLVPVACSSSHVGFCALRLEPIWTSLGQAAGIAAASAAHGTPVGEVPVASIQRRLHERGGATIYVSDILPTSPHFAAVQWWGSLGGLHGVNPMPAQPGQRGEHLFGQYYHAFPGHAAELEKPLDAELKAAWLKLAKQQKLDLKALEAATTRGEFITAAYKQTAK